MGNLAFGTASIDALGNVQSAGTRRLMFFSVSAAGGDNDLGDLRLRVINNLAFGTASIDALGNVTQSAGTKTVGDVLSVSAAGGLTLSGDLGDLEANTSGTLTIQDANDLFFLL